VQLSGAVIVLFVYTQKFVANTGNTPNQINFAIYT